MALGSNVGGARGSITIDTSQAQQAPATMQNVAQGINRAMNTVGTSVNRAQASVNSFAGSFRGLGGAIGVGLGVREIANFAVETNQLATAFDRQSVAARNLAGSQSELNELLEAYDAATGGAIDRAAALSDVTRLLSIGFADNVEEIDRFTRAVRGISIATGRPQEMVATQLQIEMLNQTGLRLDQVGLGMEEVRKKADELRSATKGLSAEQAYQQAVLDVANDKFGDLTKSAEAQVTGLEDLAKQWKNFRLEIGQISQGPVNFIGSAMANWLKTAAADLQAVNDALIFMGQAIGLIDRNLNRFTANGVSPTAGWSRRERGGPADIAKSPAADDLRSEWSAGILELSQRTNEDLADQHRDYQQQRADAEQEYQQSVSREADDFNRQRQRAEQDHAKSIADIHADAMRREEDMAADLARSIARMHADSNERVADLHEDHNERIAEMDEDFNRDQQRREEKFKDDLLSAAGRLDAIKILELRKDRARELKDRKDAHDEQKRDLKDQLAERLDDERNALNKSIANANEAHQQQLEEAREADARRLADMQADFILRQQREDEDRAVRLQRMAEDHQDQLAEMDRAHADRIAQISRHAAEERKQLDFEHKQAMIELGVRNEAWLKEVEDFEKKRKKIYESVWGLEAFMQSLPPGHPAQGDPYTDRVLPAGNGVSFPVPVGAASGMGNRSVSVGQVAITVNGAPGQSAYDIGAEVREQFTLLLEELGR